MICKIFYFNLPHRVFKYSTIFVTSQCLYARATGADPQVQRVKKAAGHQNTTHQSHMLCTTRNVQATITQDLKYKNLLLFFFAWLR
jgi:hypothetical protein